MLELRSTFAARDSTKKRQEESQVNDIAIVLGFWVAYCLAVYIFVVRRRNR